jgi:hypothetical protein
MTLLKFLYRNVCMNISTYFRRSIFCLTLLLAACMLVSNVFAQTLLPVKDYSVGNRFVYRVDGQIGVESVVKDTIINRH